MILAALAAISVTAAAPAPPGLAEVGRLAGCWKAPAEVRGRDATSIIRGEWHLGGRYFVLHVRSLTKEPYEAAITYGAGETPEAIGSFWMDTFGGLYEPSLGLGGLSPGGFTLKYRFPDAVYVNQFQARGSGWRWTIIEHAVGKPDKIFASYDLQPTVCGAEAFDF